jgi:hypothetical protein
MPSAEDLSELSKQHGLVGAKARRLENRIRLIARVLQANALEPALPPGPARAGRLRRMGRIARDLSAIAEHVESGDDGLRRLLRQIWADDVGLWLSTHGFAEGAGIMVPTSFSSRTLKSRQVSSREGPYRAMEPEMASRRTAAAADVGEHVVAALAGRLGTCLTQYLALERMSQGGRPGDRYRIFLIQQLLAIFPDVFDVMPTTTSTGRFVGLCTAVVHVLGLDATGIEKAVQRQMTKARKMAASS